MKFQVKGEPLPVVVLELESGEAVYTESGGMGWMTKGFDMSSNMEGGLFGGLARKMSGESLFMTTYTCNTPGTIAFPASMPGRIIPMELQNGESLICQKDSFLVAERSVTLGIHFKKRLGAGLFGGEGFILQKITGPGYAFLEIDGSVEEYTLDPGEEMLVDTGHVAMFEPSVNFDIEMVKGFKNILFGGEGLFLTRLRGPGKVWLQTMPISNLAGRIIPFMPKPGK